MVRLFVLLFSLLSSFHVQAQLGDLYEWEGQNSWQPSLDLRRVSISLHFTDEVPVPCGVHTNANACATLPYKKEGESISAPLCQIGFPRFTSPPTDQQLIRIGQAFYPCIRKESRTHNIVEHVVVSTVAQLTIVLNRKETIEDLTDCELLMAPLSRLLTPVQARTLGHEVLHCFRGSWHDDGSPPVQD